MLDLLVVEAYFDVAMPNELQPLEALHTFWPLDGSEDHGKLAVQWCLVCWISI